MSHAHIPALVRRTSQSAKDSSAILGSTKPRRPAGSIPARWCTAGSIRITSGSMLTGTRGARFASIESAPQSALANGHAVVPSLGVTRRHSSTSSCAAVSPRSPVAAFGCPQRRSGQGTHSRTLGNRRGARGQRVRRDINRTLVAHVPRPGRATRRTDRDPRPRNPPSYRHDRSTCTTTLPRRRPVRPYS
jgi:hypothetical protein